MRSATILLSALTLALPALSLAGYTTSYTVNRDAAHDYEITNIFLLERTPGVFGSGTWAFTVPQGSVSETITNPFTLPVDPSQALLIGITHDLLNDAPGQEHVVLMMADDAAQLSNHIAWGTLFRNTDEDQLISDIKLGSSGQDFPTIQPGLDGITRFSSGYDEPDPNDPNSTVHVPGDAEVGILDSLAQPHSAWFTPGGSFTVVAFSDGQIIGNGTSSVRFVPVPEPAPFAALGLGALALLRRRRKA